MGAGQPRFFFVVGHCLGFSSSGPTLGSTRRFFRGRVWSSPLGRSLSDLGDRHAVEVVGYLPGLGQGGSGFAPDMDQPKLGDTSHGTEVLDFSSSIGAVDDRGFGCQRA